MVYGLLTEVKQLRSGHSGQDYDRSSLAVSTINYFHHQFLGLLHLNAESVTARPDRLCLNLRLQEADAAVVEDPGCLVGA